MELQLRYTASSSAPAAVLLHGSSPAEWLRELNAWECSVWHLECYVIPTSLRNPNAAGLLIIPTNMHVIPVEGSFTTYQRIASKLFIPVNASVFPACTQEELDKILIWDLHLFHPSIGFIGFDKNERLVLSDLMQAVVPSEENWSYADAGIPSHDRLERIHMEPLAPEAMFDALKQQMDKKNLEDILPEDEKKKSGKSALDKVRESILKSFISANKKILNALPESNDGKNGVVAEMLLKFGSLMNNSLHDIENRRDAELEKLLDMFDKNIDEALRYAIPLDATYMNRGQTEVPSDKLGKHSTDFTLSGLGGGGKADYWNVDKYYNNLRTQYLRAAQEEIRKGNFEKAAYIYAHLLNDFSAAANVLIQGKYFREAAIIYKDHLNDAAAAANCLESGGFYEEAVRLYLELGRHEKAGDLYRLLEHHEKAEEHYEKSVTAFLGNNDYLEASRIYRDKLNNIERESEILLAGWNSPHRAESCLRMYFNRVRDVRADKLVSEVKSVYQNCSPSRHQEFLHVLYTLREKSSDGELNNTAREIAYEILSTCFKQGNKKYVQMLKTFVEDDALVLADGLRFKINVSKSKEIKQLQGDAPIQLDNTIRWLGAIMHSNQFLAVGTKGAFLHMARGNWYANIEYYSWALPFFKDETFQLIKDNFFGNRIILNTSSGQAFEERVLPKNKYFNQELKVQGPAWQQQEIVAIQNRHMGCSLLKTNGVSLTLHSYDSKYNLIKSEPVPEGELPVSFPAIGPSVVVEGANCSYAFLNSHLIAFNEYRVNDPISTLDFGTPIYALKGLRTANETLLVIVLEKETWLLRAEAKQLGKPYKISSYRALDILFLNSEKVVLADKYEANLYSIEAQDATVYKYDSKLPIVALLPTNDRKNFAMLDITGRISILEIAEIN